MQPPAGIISQQYRENGTRKATGSTHESIPEPRTDSGTWNDLPMNMLDSTDFAALDWLYSTRMSSDSVITAERLDFLAHFTSGNGMGTFLAPATLQQRQALISRHEAASQASIMPDTMASQTIQPSMLLINSEGDPLGVRALEILHLFQLINSQSTDKSSAKLVWTAEVEALCRSFFSPANITRFLG